ncbi:uncharacterized protein LOC143259328 [Megalopta genalis]|uniref:uncharacterized protein LOC143259328 n=1 Tax=Megalopta genalis TaxID=115081 RepID=UPI003FD1DA49
MMKSTPETSRPRIWCHREEDQRSPNTGISMSTASGSAGIGAEIETLEYRAARRMQQGDLFILEASRMVLVGCNHCRWSRLRILGWNLVTEAAVLHVVGVTSSPDVHVDRRGRRLRVGTRGDPL